MTRVFNSPRLVLATHNAGKVSEFQALFVGHPVFIQSAAELHLPVPDETAGSFLGNATIKAIAGAEASNLPCLADDSGLCVDALDGAPGVDSALWVGPNKDWMHAMARVNTMLGDNPNRKAAFVSVLVLAWPDGHVEAAEGRIEGAVCWPPRGDHGFGYDPMFIPEGADKTFGEMSRMEKQRYSHRARAFKVLSDKIF